MKSASIWLTSCCWLTAALTNRTAHNRHISCQHSKSNVFTKLLTLQVAVGALTRYTSTASLQGSVRACMCRFIFGTQRQIRQILGLSPHKHKKSYRIILGAGCMTGRGLLLKLRRHSTPRLEIRPRIRLNKSGSPSESADIGCLSDCNKSLHSPATSVLSFLKQSDTAIDFSFRTSLQIYSNMRATTVSRAATPCTAPKAFSRVCFCLLGYSMLLFHRISLRCRGTCALRVCVG